MASFHLTLKYLNLTKIKGGCQSGTKVIPHDSKSDLPLALYNNLKWALLQTIDYWLLVVVLEIKWPYSTLCYLILFWWITIMKLQLWMNYYRFV